MAGSFTVHPLLTLPIFSIDVRIKTVLCYSSEQRRWKKWVGDRGGCWAGTSGRIMHKKKVHYVRHHKEMAPPSLLIQGLIRRQSAPEVFWLLKKGIRRKHFELLPKALPTDFSWLSESIQQAWSGLALCRCAEGLPVIPMLCAEIPPTSSFQPKFSLNFPSCWFSSEHN